MRKWSVVVSVGVNMTIARRTGSGIDDRLLESIDDGRLPD
jgi:hypothetical protein